MKAIGSDLRTDTGCLAHEECKSKICDLSRGQTGAVSKSGFPALESIFFFNRGSLFIMISEESTQEVKALHKEIGMRQS